LVSIQTSKEIERNFSLSLSFNFQISFEQKFFKGGLAEKKMSRDMSVSDTDGDPATYSQTFYKKGLDAQ
jgi:hypothetical protein